jgi:pimeloyl-ACP methyl ester carboxylesterase
MKIAKSVLFIILFLITQQVRSQVIDTIVTTSNYKLHFKIIKGNSMPILFEAGGGLDVTQWDSIAMTLHHAIKATLITYDRQGFGKSSMDTSNYTILNEIKGLEYSLRKLGYASSPIMLVSHSLGGFYSRLYSSRHPKQIKGIVLLDPRIPSYCRYAVCKEHV